MDKSMNITYPITEGRTIKEIIDFAIEAERSGKVITYRDDIYPYDLTITARPPTLRKG